MTRTLILTAVLAGGAAFATMTPAKAEFFGCNTPRVTHHTVSSGGYYRAGSRSSYSTYTPAPRNYYDRVSHYSSHDYTARNYRSHW